MESVFKTDKGRIRQRNEDNGGVFINSTGASLAIVADGMGGHNAGDVASQMTVQFLKESWENVEQLQSAEATENWLRENIAKVNQNLYQHAKSHLECEGMGTTLVAVVCTNDFVTYANIGDSRCYILNENGFQQITEDHSLVNELVKTGQITREDAEHHPRKNLVLRALGTELTIEADIKTIIADEGDYLLLCSDGLSDKVNDSKMEQVLTEHTEIEEKAQTLISMANESGGEDNITLVIIRFSSSDESGCNE